MSQSKITKNHSVITPEYIRELLATVIDPELHLDIVSMGLIYEVTIHAVQTPTGERPQVHIVMTLTTPGCPLAGVIQQMIRDALSTLPDFDVFADLHLELTFDPPWMMDMMSEEARAELGY